MKFSIENEIFIPGPSLAAEKHTVFFMRSSENEFFRSPGPLGKEGKSTRNLSNFGLFLPHLAPGHLFLLGRLAVPKIIYVRPVGSPENTSNIEENPNINNLT